MAIANLFGYPGKSEREEAQKEFYAYFDGNYKKMLENQAKLMDAIKGLEEKVATLQDQINALQQSPADNLAPAFNATGRVEAYDTPMRQQADAQQTYSAPAFAAADVPSPFYANLEGAQLIPMGDDMRDNALLHVEPQSSDSALVRFNALCVPMLLSWGPSALANGFDCDIINKNPNDLVAENTTTAHFEGGAWLIDGKIRIKFI